eukprot:TRINITY_DN17572_c0_g1_i5.p1 TRINITY_DN17572_c0_g1~~TRINITY_DN17572_c0_g1_i5.p1  ORF type:complete len:1631 (+),score=345.31 TRINITY_DN17572_c0_g1_i5:35-4894(+)
MPDPNMAWSGSAPAWEPKPEQAADSSTLPPAAVPAAVDFVELQGEGAEPWQEVSDVAVCISRTVSPYRAQQPLRDAASPSTAPREAAVSLDGADGHSVSTVITQAEKHPRDVESRLLTLEAAIHALGRQQCVAEEAAGKARQAARIAELEAEVARFANLLQEAAEVSTVTALTEQVTALAGKVQDMEGQQAAAKMAIAAVRRRAAVAARIATGPGPRYESWRRWLGWVRQRRVRRQVAVRLADAGWEGVCLLHPRAAGMGSTRAAFRRWTRWALDSRIRQRARAEQAAAESREGFTATLAALAQRVDAMESEGAQLTVKVQAAAADAERTVAAAARAADEAHAVAKSAYEFAGRCATRHDTDTAPRLAALEGRRRADSVSSEKAAGSADVESLKSTVGQLAAEVGEGRRDRDAMLERMRRVEDRLGTAAESADQAAAADAVEGLRQRSAQMEADLAAVSSELRRLPGAEQQAESVAELRGAVGERAAETADLRAAVEQLRSQLAEGFADWRALCGTMETDIAALQRASMSPDDAAVMLPMMQAVTGELQHVRKAFDDMAAAAAEQKELNRRLNALAQRFDVQNSENRELADRVAAACERVGRVEEAGPVLAEQLAAVRKELQQTAAATADRSLEWQALEVKMRRLHVALFGSPSAEVEVSPAVVEQMQSLSRKLDRTPRLVDLEGRMDGLEEAKREAASALQMLSGKVELLVHQAGAAPSGAEHLAGIERRLQGVGTDLDALRASAASQQAALDSAASRLPMLAGDIDSTKQHTETIEARIAADAALLSSLRQEVDELKAQSTAHETGGLAASVDSMERRTAAVEAQVADSDVRAGALQRDVEGIKAAVANQDFEGRLRALVRMVQQVTFGVNGTRADVKLEEEHGRMADLQLRSAGLSEADSGEPPEAVAAASAELRDSGRISVRSHIGVHSVVLESLQNAAASLGTRLRQLQSDVHEQLGGMETQRQSLEARTEALGCELEDLRQSVVGSGDVRKEISNARQAEHAAAEGRVAELTAAAKGVSDALRLYERESEAARPLIRRQVEVESELEASQKQLHRLQEATSGGHSTETLWEQLAALRREVASLRELDVGAAVAEAKEAGDAATAAGAVLAEESHNVRLLADSLQRELAQVREIQTSDADNLSAAMAALRDEVRREGEGSSAAASCLPHGRRTSAAAETVTCRTGEPGGRSASPASFRPSPPPSPSPDRALSRRVEALEQLVEALRGAADEGWAREQIESVRKSLDDVWSEHSRLEVRVGLLEVQSSAAASQPPEPPGRSRLSEQVVPSEAAGQAKGSGGGAADLQMHVSSSAVRKEPSRAGSPELVARVSAQQEVRSPEARRPAPSLPRRDKFDPSRNQPESAEHVTTQVRQSAEVPQPTEVRCPDLVGRVSSLSSAHESRTVAKEPSQRTEVRHSSVALRPDVSARMSSQRAEESPPAVQPAPQSAEARHPELMTRARPLAAEAAEVSRRGTLAAQQTRSSEVHATSKMQVHEQSAPFLQGRARQLQSPGPRRVQPEPSDVLRGATADAAPSQQARPRSSTSSRRSAAPSSQRAVAPSRLSPPRQPASPSQVDHGILLELRRRQELRMAVLAGAGLPVAPRDDWSPPHRRAG